MKIDKSIPPLPPTRGGTQPKQAGNAESKLGVEIVRSAEAATTASNVVQLGAAVSVKATESSFNTARVAEIKQAIAEGRFKVDPEKIADGLLSSVRDMLSKNSRAA